MLDKQSVSGSVECRRCRSRRPHGTGFKLTPSREQFLIDRERAGRHALIPVSDPQLTQHKGVTRQLVWMYGPQLFSGPELGDRSDHFSNVEG